MKKSVPAANPDAYVAALSGWQHELVSQLRTVVVKTAKLEEVVKWGHLVYFSNGPALLIRAEETRVLFGFWRGQRLRDISPALKAGGKYEMATIELREGMSISKSALNRRTARNGAAPPAKSYPSRTAIEGLRITDAIVRKLVRAAVALNEQLGNPTDAAKPKAAAKKRR